MLKPLSAYLNDSIATPTKPRKTKITRRLKITKSQADCEKMLSQENSTYSPNLGRTSTPANLIYSVIESSISEKTTPTPSAERILYYTRTQNSILSLSRQANKENGKKKNYFTIKARFVSQHTYGDILTRTRHRLDYNYK